MDFTTKANIICLYDGHQELAYKPIYIIESMLMAE